MLTPCSQTGRRKSHRFARALIGSQILAQTIFIVANQCVGRIQNIAVTAVVLLQFDLMLHTKLTHKIGHVAHACAAEGINTLVVIAHRQHRAAQLCGQARNHFDPGILQFIGVLKLVN